MTANSESIPIVLSIALILWIAEKIRPAQPLETVKGWYLRALLLNSVQALSAVLGIQLWDAWFSQYPLFSIADLPELYQTIIGYLVITFVYYWWHRFRHTVPILWRYFHQVHHSPARIEVITSFYKHPIEIAANGVLSSAILYVFLGLSPNAAGLAVLMTAIAELIYHMNIRTPRVIGLFFQRPEMHRIHHECGLHHYNYSDLPVWDMLFGTYRNPETVSNKNGFPDDNEQKLIDMLLGREMKS